MGEKVSERFIFTQCLKWTPFSWTGKKCWNEWKEVWVKTCVRGRGGLQISKVFCLLPPALSRRRDVYNGRKEITFHRRICFPCNFEPTKKKEWQEDIADNQSWKEFLEHSGPNPIKLFALLWMPQNPAIGMPSRLRKYTTSSNFTTTLCVANADFRYFFHWLVSLIAKWRKYLFRVNEICYAGARMRFVQSKFVRFLPSGCIRFSFHSTPILEAKKGAKVTYH